MGNFSVHYDPHAGHGESESGSYAAMSARSSKAREAAESAAWNKALELLGHAGWFYGSVLIATHPNTARTHYKRWRGIRPFDHNGL